MNLPDDAPFMPHAATLPASRLRVLVAGHGDPVVFLHGVGGFKELWWSTMEAFAPHARSFALAWPGHGSPPLAPDEPLLDALTQCTITACAELGLDRISLVGHSLGGNVAARVALGRPDLVRRLALIDAAVHATHLPLSGRLYTAPRWSRQTARIHRRMTRILGRFGAKVPHTHAGGLLQAWTRRCHYMASFDEAVLQAFVRAVYTGALSDDELRRITQPTLVLTGSRDILVRPAQARMLACTIPNAELVVLRGAYHTPMDEQPAAFRRTLLAFLRGTR